MDLEAKLMLRDIGRDKYKGKTLMVQIGKKI
jgi:hypothetical protein